MVSGSKKEDTVRIGIKSLTTYIGGKQAGLFAGSIGASGTLAWDLFYSSFLFFLFVPLLLVVVWLIMVSIIVCDEL